MIIRSYLWVCYWSPINAKPVNGKHNSSVLARKAEAKQSVLQPGKALRDRPHNSGP